MKSKKRLATYQDSSKLLTDERGQFTYFLLFVMMTIVLLFLFYVGLPLVQSFNTGVHSALSPTLERSKADANNIQDVNAREAYLTSLQAQEDSLTDSQNILGGFISAAPFLILVIIGIVMFMLTKRNVQTGYV